MKSKTNVVFTSIFFSSMLLFSFIFLIIVKGVEEASIDANITITDIITSSVSSPVFWILSATTALLLTLSMSSAFNILKAKLLNSDEFKETISSYNEKLKVKNSKYFVDFIKVLNKKRREEAYVHHIEKKIFKKERKLEKITILGLKLKNDIRINNKIIKLKENITREYLDSHLVWWFYNAVSPSDFEKASIEEIYNKDRTSSYEKRIMSGAYIKKIATSLFTSVIAIGFITQLIYKFKFSGSFWTIIITTIIGMGLSIWQGIKKAKSIYANEYIKVYENRTDVLKDYINWNKSNHPNEEIPYIEKIEQKYQAIEEFKKQREKEKEAQNDRQ